MTDAAGSPRDDVQRPLDESVPAQVPELTVTAVGDSDPEATADVLDLTGASAGTSRAPEAVPPGNASETDPALRPAVPAAPEPAGAGSAVTVPAPGRRAHVFRVFRTVARSPWLATRAVAAWARRPSGRLAVPGVVTATLVAAAVSTGAFLIPSAGMAPAPAATTAPPVGVPTGAPATAAPSPAPPVGIPGTPGPRQNPPEVLSGWAAQMSDPAGIPAVALQAYGFAELVVTRTTPTCRLSWTTLAAIGRVESNHGSTNDSILLADGRALPRITGLPLDGGAGRDTITDTDQGTLDGDQTYDRAVGPMQFIPSSWRLAGVDASGDGFADINNINDAALAAANYLCGGSRDLSTPDDWWAAILSYNDVQVYAEEVFAQANEYGRLSRGVG
jgi:hypothetical protein